MNRIKSVKRVWLGPIIRWVRPRIWILSLLMITIGSVRQLFELFWIQKSLTLIK